MRATHHSRLDGEALFYLAGAAVSLTLAAFFLVLFVARDAHAATIPRQALAYRSTLVRAARWEEGLSAPIATYAAQIHQESSWREDARSAVGAEGLTQFMPATAAWWAKLRPDLGPAAPWNPGWAIRSLVGYDLWLLARVQGRTACDRRAASLTSYNGGLGWWQRDAALAKRQGLDPAAWWGAVETINAGRSRAAWEESRGYPRRILLTLEPLYEAAGWGRGVCP